MSDKKPDDWETSDGRIIPLKEMSGFHIENAKFKIKEWAAHERDPIRKSDLIRWRKLFSKEQRKRYTNWIKERAERQKKRDADRSR